MIEFSPLVLRRMSVAAYMSSCFPDLGGLVLVQGSSIVDNVVLGFGECLNSSWNLINVKLMKIRHGLSSHRHF